METVETHASKVKSHTASAKALKYKYRLKLLGWTEVYRDGEWSWAKHSVLYAGTAL